MDMKAVDKWHSIQYRGEATGGLAPRSEISPLKSSNSTKKPSRAQLSTFSNEFHLAIWELCCRSYFLSDLVHTIYVSMFKLFIFTTVINEKNAWY